MNILGLSAFYHDSAACLIRDGKIVAAAQEERFSRRKHDSGFPNAAAAWCLKEAGITPPELDLVAFYEKPLLKFERLLETWLAFAPRGFRAFLSALPLWLNQKLHIPREIDRGLGGGYRGRYVFVEHHESHAASAFFPSPFEEAAILTLDGVGEWATASRGIGRGNVIELKDELRFPHSLGLLYSAFTYFTGFKVNSGEYKLMGLAPYGRPRFASRILDELVDLKDDGSFRLNLSYFEYTHGLTMTGNGFARLFGGPARRPESPLTERELDSAASIQLVTEEIMVRMARSLRAQTGLPNLVAAGGVALNCVANGRILGERIFDRIWIQPAAGDDGGALGAALFVWHQLLDKPRRPMPRDAQRGSLLGPHFSNDDARRRLDAMGALYHVLPDEDALIERIAGEVIAQKVLGYFHGPMEFGPRALGSRSILGDARSPRMQSTMNMKIKFRESFRPFAPVVLEEEASAWFTLPSGVESPYMLLVAHVAPQHRLPVAESDWAGLRKLDTQRSTIPAVTHVDWSARVQTVDAERNPRFHKLLRRLHRETGCPVLINTSFNVRGEPIVCSPEDAYRCFMATNIDVLVVEDMVLYKDEQRVTDSTERARHLRQFGLD